ncbi:MAG: SRPBCC family protein [Candidatus Omnitrophica bacterium]|nr:SRPBCC family protein [Candidatus Omnitrophota bacterium]
MPDNDIMEISITRVIPARKWRVIRFLTKVQDFPSFIPTVKEAVAIQKRGNIVRTKWHILVNSVPITWVEEDTLDLQNNALYFHSIEGDLEEFAGEWRFQDLPTGTRVTVNVRLRVGIPAIKEFADLYIKKILQNNFEFILEALEKRSIALRYSEYKRTGKPTIDGFGVIGHFYNVKHLEKCLKMLDPGFKMPSQEFLGQLFNITPSFKLYDMDNFKSKSGESTRGAFFVATFIPDMIERDMWSILGKVVRACKIAEKQGIGIVTLGGFSSIVAERIGHEITEEVDIPVTTGNTFTAAMVIDGVNKAARALNKDINGDKVAIIGGTGDIGSACARHFALTAGHLTITGRTKENLRRMQKELSSLRKARIVATTNNEQAVRDADVVIACASVSASILKTEWFKPGAIICDVGYPKNISYAPVTRDDILIFSGGLSKSPTPVTFPVDTGLPAKDVLYGCFAEAIILALEKRFENFSFGRGNITLEKIDEIRQMGKKHGFEAADFYWGDKLVDVSNLGRTKEAAKV